MNLLLDKLAATLIAGVLFLMVFTVNSRNEQTMVETTAFYALTRHTEDFAKILRRDLQSIDEVVTVTETSHYTGGTAFEFKSRIGSETTVSTITYVKRAAQGRQGYFSIERYVNGALSGGSKDIITDWEIKALNEDAGEIVDPDNAAQVYVRFEASSPFTSVEAEVIESIKWESRFFPPLRN